jgi:DNA-binding response OmpR family regulator
MRRINGNVFFISNNSDIAALIVRILKHSGCSAISVTPAELLTTLAEKDFDCLILDWVADEDRDLKFYFRLRSLAPQKPIILFTGVQSQEEVLLSLRKLPEAEELLLLNLDSLIADIFPYAYKLTELSSR